jgi:hypothetical protein
MTVEKYEGSCVACDGIKSRDWYARLDRMPSSPDGFRVVGEVYVPNPGIDPFLTPTQPQGINPMILLLDLYLIQKPGAWPRVVVWKSVRYDKVKPNAKYTQVQVLCGGTIIAGIAVEPGADSI